jgi:hypothetical protein
MKLRWVEREVFAEYKLPNYVARTRKIVKVLQYWDDGKWVDVPTEVEEV